MKTDKSGQGKKTESHKKAQNAQEQKQPKSFCASCAFLWLTSFSWTSTRLIRGVSSSNLHRRISKEYPGAADVYVCRRGLCLPRGIAERYWSAAVQQLK
jgi:hypothetical protein